MSVEEDGRLLVALDDEREGECVRSPEGVRRMTEQEDWQSAMAAVESAPACQMLPCGSCPAPLVLSHIQAAL